MDTPHLTAPSALALPVFASDRLRHACTALKRIHDTLDRHDFQAFLNFALRPEEQAAGLHLSFFDAEWYKDDLDQPRYTYLCLNLFGSAQDDPETSIQLPCCMEYELGELYLRADQIVLANLVSLEPEGLPADLPSDELDGVVMVLQGLLIGSRDTATFPVVVGRLLEEPLELLGDVVVQRARPFTLVTRSLVMSVCGVGSVRPELRETLLSHAQVQAELLNLSVRASTLEQTLQAELKTATSR